MTVAELKDRIKDLPDDYEVVIPDENEVVRAGMTNVGHYHDFRFRMKTSAKKPENALVIWRD